MKIYSKPELEKVKFDVEDVITTSGGGIIDGGEGGAPGIGVMPEPEDDDSIFGG